MHENYLHSDLTRKIIKAYYTVYNTLGYGFLEKVYENALFCELEEMKFIVERQKRIEVFYNNILVGTYCADLVVDEKLIIEIKAANCLCEAHESQLINYLKATNLEVGILLNFGKEPEFRRKVFSNHKKPRLKH